ncbi:MAG: hypothetical protein J5798_03660 [Spirochaetaceae bacterium]|nr:hypothetical protein [Spirochaetaceae bacterium]
MKKVLICLILLSATVTACFASGNKEEQKKLENMFYENPNVESVKMRQDGKADYGSFLKPTFHVEIALKNGGFFSANYCDTIDMNKELEVELIGEYNVSFLYRSKKIEDKERIISMGVNAYIAGSNFLNLPINTIDDFIDYYDTIYNIVKELSKETFEERKARRHMHYQDSDFLKHYGNYETEDYWGYIFAKQKDELWW